MLKWLGKHCWFHDWEDLGIFQYVSLFGVFGRARRVYRCKKCGAQREEIVDGK